MKLLLSEIKENMKKISIVLILLLLLTGINIVQPLIAQKIIDEGLYNGMVNLVIKYSVLSFCLYLVGFGIGFGKEKIRIDVKNTFNKKLWDKVVEKIYRVNMSKINSHNSVEFVQCIENDIAMISGIFDDGAMFAITEIFGVIGGIIGLFLVSYRMAFFVILFIPVKIIVVYLMSKKNMHIMQDYVQNMQDYSKWIGQYVNGIKDIRLWGLFDKVHSSFEIQKDNELDSLKRKSILTFLNMNIDNLLIELVIIGIYVIGVDFAKKEMITIGGIIVFITYCTYILAPLSSVFNIIFVLSGIKPSIARVNKFMEEDEEISEDNVHVNEISSISFNNVSFSYNDFEVLSAVSLKLSKGQKVVIFGKNGCGKTTLVNLLLRIENANKGQIYVNNISINKLDIDLYRKQLAVVSTEFYLFNDTILNNICVDTTADYNKLNNIITVCGLNELIEQRGMDFLVGENGEYLSAGQRQRVCLARALISNRDYLFLDEATSNLDVESKNRVLEYLLRVNKGMIIISHDLDIFRIVDKIVYMKEGHINDQGTLAELMSRNESFKKEICEL